MKLIKAALSAIILASLSACETVPTVAPLILPPIPIYPLISESELDCMSPEAYTRLVRRAVLAESHIETIHAAVNAYNKAAQ